MNGVFLGPSGLEITVIFVDRSFRGDLDTSRNVGRRWVENGVSGDWEEGTKVLLTVLGVVGGGIKADDDGGAMFIVTDLRIGGSIGSLAFASEDGGDIDDESGDSGDDVLFAIS